MQRPSPSAIPRDTVEGGDTVEGDDAATVLDRIRTELASLHAVSVDLQTRLGPALAAAAGDEAILRASQSLDLLSQSLDGLATFAGAVSRGGRDAGRFDAAAAAAQVSLYELSSRLAGGAPSNGHCHGDLDLF